MAATTTTAPAGVEAPRRRRSSVSSRDARHAWWFIAPWLVGFVVFTAWPMVYSAYLSLTDYDVINDPRFVGFDNYRELFADPKVALALRNTLIYTVMAVPAHILLALGLALLLDRAARSAGFFRTAFFLPKMTPPVAIGVLLLLLFNGQRGAINTMLGWIGIDGPAWTTDPDWVKPGLVMMGLWTVGSTVIILLAALRNVPTDLYDAARVDGAGFWHRTRAVTLPMISGPLFFVVVVNTIASLQLFTEAYTAFFGSGNTTYSNDAALFYVIYLFQQAFEFLHMGYASALAWLLFLVIMAITGIQVLVSRRVVYYEGDAR
ncbi:carbohydrate ABC transporter permease [Cellulomonas algicola]|uniref:carbohydrate ABC transporter permease n=1 Tax=Cellulomonas algicola TaxID=2071633 RepID=UPI000F580429|nr:sugar ABC transporter permease [Cellulomonas algicola]